MMLPEKYNRILQDSPTIVSTNAVFTAVQQLADDISRTIAQLNPVVLVVLKGGGFLAGLLLPKLLFQLEVEYVRIKRGKRYSAVDVSSISVENMPEVQGRNVLIIDDILDTGETLYRLRAICEAHGALSVHAAVLVDKVQKARQGVAEYTGLYVYAPKDAFLFGAGMDYDGYFRNIPIVKVIVDDMWSPPVYVSVGLASWRGYDGNQY